MKLRTLLVDDEPIALRGLQHLLQSEPDIEIVGLCQDGAEAIASISELKPDLVFLDIQMPEVTGFDVIGAIGLAHMPSVIFVTAYDEFAVRAFDVHALDYVLKPIDPPRLQQALQKARALKQSSSTVDEKSRSDQSLELRNQISAVLVELGVQAPPAWSKRLAIKHHGRVLLFEVHDVDRIEAAGNYVEIYVRQETQNKTYLMRESLSSLEQRLNPAEFVRISRSSLIQIARVRELQTMFNGDFVAVLKDGSVVSGSRRYRQALDSLLRV